MRPLALYAIVSISGAAVLAVEILGTRVLGPFYGVSLFLWSALISVTLAALSVGYAVGGWWADRGPRSRRLVGILAGAGAWLLLVPFLRHPVLAATEPLGLRAAVLVTSTILFFPPLMLLGMVSPLAIRLRAQRLEEVGRTAGNLFAVSTVASVVAALLTGFWLIPSVGVMRLTSFIGLALFVAAAIAWFASSSGARRSVAVILLVPPVLFAGWTASRADALSRGVVFSGQSAYAEIRVLDTDDVRYLLIDGGVHTAVEHETGHTQHEYVIVSDLAKELFQQPGRMLLIGLGGGAAAQSYSWSGWDVEAVEIDPVVTRVAREYFGLREHEARVHHMDGRRFLKETPSRYDVILLDAFGSSAIPFHLVTLEVFELVRQRLNEGGVLVMNIEAVGWHHPLVHSLGATLDRVFEHVEVLPVAEPPTALGNLVIFASDRPMSISNEALGRPLDAIEDTWEHWRALQRNHAWDNRFEPAADWGPVLTDDLNPVSIWAEEINRVARHELHDYFDDRASW